MRREYTHNHAWATSPSLSPLDGVAAVDRVPPPQLGLITTGPMRGLPGHTSAQTRPTGRDQVPDTTSVGMGSYSHAQRRHATLRPKWGV